MKQLYFNSNNEQSRSVVEREISMLNSIKSEFVVRIVDYEISDSSAKLILSYAPYDLKQYIENTMFPLSE